MESSCSSVRTEQVLEMTRERRLEEGCSGSKFVHGSGQVVEVSITVGKMILSREIKMMFRMAVKERRR